MRGSVVAGADGDTVEALRGFQMDAVERAVVLQGCGSVDEAVLIAQAGLDDLQGFLEVSFRGVVGEDTAAGL